MRYNEQKFGVNFFDLEESSFDSRQIDKNIENKIFDENWLNRDSDDSFDEFSETLSALKTLYSTNSEEQETLAGLAAEGLSKKITSNRELVLAAGAERLIAVRRTPILSTQLNEALPAWTSGLEAERIIGPVLDAFGRDIWIHIFRRVRQVRFVRTPGGDPFLSIPHKQVFPYFSAGPQTQHDVAAGSLWLATGLFASVPSDTYSGVRISDGVLTFSAPIQVTGDEVIIPPSVTCTLEVTLNPAPRDTDGVAPDSPGADARNSTYIPPQRLKIEIGGVSSKIVALSNAQVGAFGDIVELTPAAAPLRYLADFNRLLVPMTAAKPDFKADSAAAADFGINDEAPILSGGLALPAARIDPDQLGEASGVGPLLLELGPGLRSRVSQEKQFSPLGDVILMVDEARLAFTAMQAKNSGETMAVRIGDANANSQASIVRNNSGSIRFFALTQGQEAVQFSADAALRPDLPRDVAGDRIPMKAPNATVIISKSGTVSVLALFGRTNTGDRRRCFQLTNALLRANEPTHVVLHGLFDGARITAGALWSAYPLSDIIPTLPDPYAANIGSSNRRSKSRSSALISRFTVQPGDNSVEFFLTGPAPLAASTASSLNVGATALGVSGSLNVASTMALTNTTSLAAGRNPNAGALDNLPAAIGDALDFESVQKIILVDMSSSAGQLGVALRPAARRNDDFRGSAVSAPTATAQSQPLSISALDMEVDPRYMVMLTLPAVQWEPVVAVPPEIDETPAFPDRVVFLNSGVPTVIDVPGEGRVPIAPIPAYDAILDRFANEPRTFARARFTLPFGMIAAARLTPPTNAARGAEVSETRPQGEDLQGAPQLTIQARDTTLPHGATPALPGHTVQLPIAIPAGAPGAPRSVLGDSVTSIFNDNLGAASPEALVPLTRVDLSGYGESIFSKWINPKDALTQVEKVEFDVPVGRVGREVVQVRSILLPYGVPVIRTVTLQRKADALVGRSDSGWVAAGDGAYGFSNTGAVTHPGVVTRIINVEEIRETGQKIIANGQEFVAVYFQGDLILDGAADPAPVKRHLGYVRLTADPPAFDVATYSSLIEQAGPMCGPVNALISVAGGEHKMRIKRVGVAVSGSEFAMGAWGSLIFPGGGEWSVLEAEDGLSAPAPVPDDEGLPLIRQGQAGAPSSAPYRFAAPQDLLSVSPQKDYGILHSMGMQRVFYRRPRIETSAPDRIVSTERPVIADPFALARAVSVFPEQDRCIPFPSANYALEAQADGSYILDGPGTFPAGLGRRTVGGAGSVESVIDYSDSDVTYELNTADATPWRFELTNATRISAHTSMGDVVTMVAQIRSDGELDSRFEDPQVQVGGPVQIVQDLLTILEDLGVSAEPEVRFENKPKFSFGLRIPFVDQQGKDFQVPPRPDPEPFIIFADTGFSVETTIKKDESKSKIVLGGSPMFAVKSVPGLYVVAILKFSLILSEKDGTTFIVTIGFGLAMSEKFGPLKIKALLAITFFGVVGETVMGWGGGFLMKAEAAIKPIASVSLRVENVGARLTAQAGTDQETVFFISKATVAINISVFLVLSFSTEWDMKVVDVVRGPLSKDDAPSVL